MRVGHYPMVVPQAVHHLRDRVAVRVGRLLGRPPYQERLLASIARHAPGRSFLDVGCMWFVHGAYALEALDRGATDVTGMDLREASPEFAAANRRRGGHVRFVQGDVNDPATIDRVGRHDVVFCSGVLYHVPNPLLTLDRLRALCGEVLILGSATIPEQALPQGAVYYPFLDEPGRKALGHRTPPTHPKIGLDTEYRPAWGYSNYFWGFAPSCLEALVRTAGFAPVERYVWRRATCLVCRLAT
jgi:Methyltransferase domain